MEYLFSSITQYQREDGMMTASRDGSYIDDGSKCVGHTDEIDNYALTLRTIRSRAGESCKMDGAITLSILVNGVRSIVQIPDYHHPSSEQRMLFFPGSMPVGKYNILSIAKRCETTLAIDKCKRLAEIVTEQTSAGFCELYKHRELNKSI